MSNQESTNLILEFAELFTGNQICKNAINTSLKIICENFSFDSALVYEVDQYSTFNAIEHTQTDLCPDTMSFSANCMLTKYFEDKDTSKINIIKSSEQNSENQRDILSFFSAKTLAIQCIVDDKSKIYGFIIFSSKQVIKSINNENTLSLLLSMLNRYIQIRIYQNKVKFSQESLESILDNTGIDIYVNDFNTHEILYANKSMAAPYGGIQEFNSKRCWEVLFPNKTGQCEFCPQKNLIDEEGNPTKVYSWNYQRPFDGVWFRVFSAAFRWIDGRLAHVVSSADITENKKNEEIIKYMANYDSLTNLPNRRMLIEECEKRINVDNSNSNCSILFFDIDNFKNINDELGHESGDEFLIKLGEFFSGIPMLKDSIYRNGGDEFVAVIDGNVAELGLKNLVKFIHERFKKPWELKKGKVFCNTSVGISKYPQDGQSAEELLQKADQAMYHVKKHGGGGICFWDELESKNLK